ncbi:hypothetical protein BBAL3_1720 [Brevundimonas sp. BAL3]|nr:hypothetical protein BBAL3_1720 [Brevundimonas sp. BAL3]
MLTVADTKFDPQTTLRPGVKSRTDPLASNLSELVSSRASSGSISMTCV